MKIKQGAKVLLRPLATDVCGIHYTKSTYCELLDTRNRTEQLEQQLAAKDAGPACFR